MFRDIGDSWATQQDNNPIVRVNTRIANVAPSDRIVIGSSSHKHRWLDGDPSIFCGKLLIEHRQFGATAS